MRIFHLWAIFFVYASILSLTIQLIVLPLIFPSMHRGDGVMYGGDWVLYQYWSQYYASFISEHGWTYWELRPQGFGLVGIVSAIYAFIGVFKPYVLIPIFAALHSLGSLCILLLMQKLGVRRSIAFFSALPYLVFPSSLLWVSQLMKDAFTLNASLIMLYGLVGLFSFLKVNSMKANIKNQLFFAILIFISFGIIFIIRPYLVELTFIYFCLVLFGLNIWLVYLLAKRKLKKHMIITSILMQIFLVISTIIFINNTSEKTPSMSNNTFDDYIEQSKKENIANIIKLKKLSEEGLLPGHIDKYWEEDKVGSIVNSENQSNQLYDEFNESGVKNEAEIFIEKDIETLKSTSLISTISQTKKLLPELDKEIPIFIPKNILDDDAKAIAIAEKKGVNPYLDINFASNYEIYKSREWEKLNFIPFFIDNKFKQIYVQRNYFYLFGASGNTTFDYGIDLNNTIKMFKYLPRAIQIGYLAPFPLSIAKSINVNLMNKVVNIEMLLIYIMLPGILFAILLWRRKIEFWIMLSFSLFFTVFPVFAFPNIGALVRYRYAGIMIILAISISAIITIYLNYKNKKND